MSWATQEPTLLGEHIDILSGFAFKSKQFSEQGELPVARIRDVKRGFSKTYYSGDYDPKYGIDNGDLLVGMDGEFNAALWRGGKSLLNQRVCKIQPKPTLDFDYLGFILPIELKKIEDRTPFVTVKHLSVKSIRAIEIPLPPLAEQKRIAAILDKADAIRRKRQEAIALTEEFLRSAFLDMFGDPVTNPKGWEVKPFGQLATNVDSDRIPIKKADRANRQGEYRYFGASGAIDTIDDYLFEGAHLLIAEDGANLLARSTPVAFRVSGRFWVNNHAHVVRENGQAELCFLETFFSLISLRKWITGSAQPKLNRKKLDSIPVPLPPSALQSRFRSIADTHAGLGARFNDGIQDSEHLFNALVQRAFRGEL